MSHPVKPPPSARRLLRTPEDLIAAGLVPPEQKDALDAVAQNYATAIPPAFLDLIEQPDDPIGVQVIPSPEELLITPEERSDPIGDEALSPVPGIVHRYADRALLKPLLVCPLYCRFCFRREHVGPDGGVLDDAALEKALDWLRSHPAIREVILTGGDPLMLSPRRLGQIITALSAMPHVTTIRLHTRVPVAAPERVTDALLDVLETDKALWMAVHINHAREMSEAARACLKRLVRRGVPLLGQSVLLRGVNDSEQALEDLFRSMVEVRMRPYYLHQLDPAPGTARFHVPVAEGQRLLAGLRGRVTGLAWPTYVLDIPGGYGKVPLGPDYVDGALQVRDPEGRPHTLQRL
ncbi:lysine-2,3-aminomutase-like protein [Acetobacter cerevisiae]|uniref:Lysine 2,3-aminomutase n=1 Tax=Acetobacter cerevisiae TaxID=178900 RepID=A0A149UUA9_9PROT|nr:lysine-2,3-aminomutase-like protein [Acetobacter cerevisiae]KXV71424.1 lysine 2,3-aminomutase [Acetobacter cerevisiae]MCP1245127.1 lysine-2,3-aminomutase-like protein [Acetobacter cerevisiae]MCP1254646.1 lysine-2,3-aminomutase-like protein [Acetobacter cerevisiae]